jgi:hypothetical protein
VKELTQNIGYKLRYRFVFATPRCLASHEMRGWNRKPFGGSKPGALFCSFGIILHTQMILGDKSNKYRHLNLLIFFAISCVENQKRINGASMGQMFLLLLFRMDHLTSANPGET